MSVFSCGTLRWSSLIKRVLTEQKAGPHLGIEKSIKNHEKSIQNPWKIHPKSMENEVWGALGALKESPNNFDSKRAAPD